MGSPRTHQGVTTRRPGFRPLKVGLTQGDAETPSAQGYRGVADPKCPPRSTFASAWTHAHPPPRQLLSRYSLRRSSRHAWSEAKGHRHLYGRKIHLPLSGLPPLGGAGEGTAEQSAARLRRSLPPLSTPAPGPQRRSRRLRRPPSPAGPPALTCRPAPLTRLHVPAGERRPPIKRAAAAGGSSWSAARRRRCLPRSPAATTVSLFFYFFPLSTAARPGTANARCGGDGRAGRAGRCVCVGVCVGTLR